MSGQTVPCAAARLLAADGTVGLCEAGDEGIGTSYDGVGSGETVTVELDHKSVEVTASGAITANNPCYPAASGKVSATVNGRRIGKALESVTDGNKFEMMIMPPAS